MEEKESFAIEVLKDYKKHNSRLFWICIALIVALSLETGYLVYLLNDIGTEKITKTKETTTYDMEAENGINNVIGGDNNGKNEIHKD